MWGFAARPLCLLLAALSFGAVAQGQGGVGYPTVDAALQALEARSDVRISVQGGWTIAEDRAAGAVWSFTPPDHPAHPAVVKRAVVERDGQAFIDMTALCQASKGACDKLIADFQALNERTAQSARKAPAVPPSVVEAERIGDDSFRLTLKSFRSASVDAGQQELLPKAREVCAGKNISYGHYQFDLLEPFSGPSNQRSLVLKQEITCGGAGSPPPPAVSVANGDRSWRPTSAQVQRVERNTYAYFAAKDTRRYRDAYAQLSPSQKSTTPLERWSSLAEDFNVKAGDVKARSIRKITWYKDPPNVAPGVYAAVDFSSEFSNAAAHCGYVAWHEQADGSFLLVREEQNFIDKASAAKMKPAERERVRAQFGC